MAASFEIFDRNGDGTLSKDEVRAMLTMVVKQVTRAQLKAKQKKVSGDTPIEIDAAGQKKIEEILEEIFNKVDTDRSGSIDVNEFMKGFSEHPQICGFFKRSLSIRLV
jgi:Ca2+-binding EF-hand superfamily protein